MVNKFGDFNSIFWEVWGINNKIHRFEDIFHINYIDKNKAKKKFYKFKNSQNMRIDSFFEMMYSEPNEFYLLFDNLFYKVEGDVSLELIKELNNITFTYRISIILEINDINKIVNMFAFQIAYVIEKICNKNIDISIFEKSLKENSFAPYIKYHAKKKNKFQKGIALDIHNTYYMMLEHIHKEYESKLKYIEDSKVFENDISKWNKGELPEFLKLLAMNIVLFSEKEKNEQRSQLILMLILRALLHIKKEYKLIKDIESQFIDKLNYHRVTIKKMLNENKIEDLTNLKLKYCIDFEDLISNMDAKNIDLNMIIQYMIPYFSEIKNINIKEELESKFTKYMKKLNWHY